MTDIHPTAVIEDGAQIAASAKIGPFCWISSRAKIGENVQLLGRVTIMGDTTVGEGTIVFPGACLGGGPQDHGNEFKEEAKLIIGKNNIIRENVTMHAGTPKEHFTTTVGDGGMFMINSHVAHDCVVGNNVIMTNNAVIGGHVRLGDGVIIGGNAAVHQFCRIGRKAMIGGLSGVDRDVIPFGIITKAFMFIFKGKEGTFEDRLAQAHEKFKDNEMVMEQVKFIDEALQGRRKIMVAE